MDSLNANSYLSCHKGHVRQVEAVVVMGVFFPSYGGFPICFLNNNFLLFRFIFDISSFHKNSVCFFCRCRLRFGEERKEKLYKSNILERDIKKSYVFLQYWDLIVN